MFAALSQTQRFLQQTKKSKRPTNNIRDIREEDIYYHYDNETLAKITKYRSGRKNGTV